MGTGFLRKAALAVQVPKHPEKEVEGERDRDQCQPVQVKDEHRSIPIRAASSWPLHSACGGGSYRLYERAKDEKKS